MEFKDRLVALRKEKGMSQEDLAEYLGLSRQALSKYELGLSEPDISTLMKLSSLFEVSTDYLLGKSDGRKEKGETIIDYFRSLPKKRYSYFFLFLLMIAVLSLYTLPAIGKNVASISNPSYQVSLVEELNFYNVLQGSAWLHSNPCYFLGVLLNLIAFLLVISLLIEGLVGFFIPFKKNTFFSICSVNAIIASIFSLIGSSLWCVGYYEYINDPYHYMGEVYMGMFVPQVVLTITTILFLVFYMHFQKKEKKTIL